MWTSDTVAGAPRAGARWGAQHVARHVGGVSRVGCRAWQYGADISVILQEATAV